MNDTCSKYKIQYLRSQVLELALDLVPRLRQVLALQIGSLPFSVSLTLTLGIIGIFELGITIKDFKQKCDEHF